jgi:hypothetical protein
MDLCICMCKRGCRGLRMHLHLCASYVCIVVFTCVQVFVYRCVRACVLSAWLGRCLPICLRPSACVSVSVCLYHVNLCLALRYTHCVCVVLLTLPPPPPLRQATGRPTAPCTIPPPARRLRAPSTKFLPNLTVNQV